MTLRITKLVHQDLKMFFFVMFMIISQIMEWGGGRTYISFSNFYNICDLFEVPEWEISTKFLAVIYSCSADKFLLKSVVFKVDFKRN